MMVETTGNNRIQGWSPAATLLAVAVAYYVGAQLGFILRFPPTTPSVLWPPNSILTATLLLTPVRRWWHYLLAALPAHLAAELPVLPPLLVIGLFATNCVEALVAAAAEPAMVGEIVNVGNDRRSTFLEVAEILRDLVAGTEIVFTDFTPERKAQEPGDFVSDISKIRRLTGWAPRIDLRDGLARTVDFYRERRTDYF